MIVNKQKILKYINSNIKNLNKEEKILLKAKKCIDFLYGIGEWERMITDIKTRNNHINIHPELPTNGLHYDDYIKSTSLVKKDKNTGRWNKTNVVQKFDYLFKDNRGSFYNELRPIIPYNIMNIVCKYIKQNSRYNDSDLKLLKDRIEGISINKLKHKYQFKNAYRVRKKLEDIKRDIIYHQDDLFYGKYKNEIKLFKQLYKYVFYDGNGYSNFLNRYPALYTNYENGLSKTTKDEMCCFIAEEDIRYRIKVQDIYLRYHLFLCKKEGIYKSDYPTSIEEISLCILKYENLYDEFNHKFEYQDERFNGHICKCYENIPSMLSSYANIKKLKDLTKLTQGEIKQIIIKSLTHYKNIKYKGIGNLTPEEYIFKVLDTLLKGLGLKFKEL